MRVNRQEFLQKLESVAPGLATRENIEQSSCFIFQGGKLITFNDQIACRLPCKVDWEGAVTAAPLLEILNKMPDDELELTATDGELRYKAKGNRKGGVRMMAEVLLPTDSLEAPTTWQELHPEFCEAIGVVQQCAGRDEQLAILTCVHIHPKFVEACDNYQLARYPLDTGFAGPTLVQRTAIRHITELGMTQFAETESWVHFRNPSKLQLSCRRYVEEYPPLGHHFKGENGVPTTLPASLGEAAESCEVFSKETADNNVVKVEVRQDAVIVTGRGASGWHSEKKPAKYDGEPLAFCISPKLLAEISSKHTDCFLSGEKLQVNGGKFKYITCLAAPEGT